MDAALERFVSESLGGRISLVRPAQGGSIATSHSVELEDGRSCFIKRYGADSAAIVRAEAEGLRWITVPGGPRVPEVLAASQDTSGFLALEWIPQGRIADDDEARMGRELAVLHAFGADAFGFPSDNYIGPLPQSNRQHADWVTFYAKERIEPQIRLARESGRFSQAQTKLAERVIARLPELCGPAEPPARLHGDLWSGNSLYDDGGRPCIFDPAVYGGHREMDLAMMRLFGGIGTRVFDAYDEAFALAKGHEERIELYQLYPVLVHVNLFGGGYAGSATRILKRYA